MAAKTEAATPPAARPRRRRPSPRRRSPRRPSPPTRSPPSGPTPARRTDPVRCVRPAHRGPRAPLTGRADFNSATATVKVGSMRPIPAPRIGESHGLLRAIGQRERIRLDEFVTEFSVEDLFHPGLENALGRTRQFVSYARAAGLLKEDQRDGRADGDRQALRARAGDPDAPFDVSDATGGVAAPPGAREAHDRAASTTASPSGSACCHPCRRGRAWSVLDFGRALGYLGRAGWDSDNTLQIQGERYLLLLRDIALIDGDRSLTPDRHHAQGGADAPRSTCRCWTSPPSSTPAAPRPFARGGGRGRGVGRPPPHPSRGARRRGRTRSAARAGGARRTGGRTPAPAPSCPP